MRPIHQLKISTESFDAVYEGKKNAEFDSDYTGIFIETHITHIQTGYGIPEGYGMISFAIPIQTRRRVEP